MMVCASMSIIAVPVLTRRLAASRKFSANRVACKTSGTVQNRATDATPLVF